MKRMRIVFSTDNYWPRISGMAVAIDALTDGLTELGHEVYVLAPEYPNARDFDEKRRDSNIIRFPSIKLFFLEEDRLVSPLQKRAVYHAIRSVNPDIVHVHTEFSMGVYASQYAEKHDIPLIYTAHTYWEEYVNYISFLPNFLIRKFGENLRNLPFKYDCFITVPSSAMKTVLQSYSNKKPIRIIPTGIVKKEFGGLGSEGARIGSAVITSITATCIFFEIIGPILTKIGLKKAGEIDADRGGQDE